MINIYIVLLIILTHWIADFVLQTDWQAKNKSSNNKALLTHTLNYSLTLWVLIMILTEGNVLISGQYWLITFICHTLTDYYTSRLNTKLYKANKIHYFFVSIGFDQVLHYTQLLLTYYYLSR